MVGDPDDPGRPFSWLDAGGSELVVTRRMLREQERVAEALARRAVEAAPEEARLADVDAVLARLFPEDPGGEAARAVRLAEARRLAVIVGGPGTGKTYSVTRLLAALLAGARGRRAPRIEIAAPTGKAAVRVHEAILESLDPTAPGALDVSPEVRAALERLVPKTLHRLLGVRTDGSVRHGPERPLPADVVVVDEVSMVDLVAMRRLLEGVDPAARLVLLGDRDQLASVEAGSVLADVVGEPSSGPLRDAAQRFTRSRRFASAPDIALLAASLQSYAGGGAEPPAVELPAAEAERVALAVALATGRAHAPGELAPGERITWLGAPAPGGEGRLPAPSEADLDRLAAPYWEGVEELRDGQRRRLPGYAALLRAELDDEGRHGPSLLEPGTQLAILAALDHYRVLAVHRRGPLGVEGLERALAERVRARLGLREVGGRAWLGRPLIVTENAYDVGLLNGDVGLVLPTQSGLAAVFPGRERGALRQVPLSRLPSHEGALAMTVHKSQGSQFDAVALVLAGRRSPIQTRELVYTGVTRAKNRLAWLGAEAELAEALGRRTQRASALGAMLSTRLAR